jgi:L-ascorbate metabolism protein UlaG (beta-lactamase superfamily)
MNTPSPTPSAFDSHGPGGRSTLQPQRPEDVLAALTARARLNRAAVATRAGVPRYAKAIVQSVREARAPRAVIDPLHDLKAFESRTLSAFWIGHATVLMRVGGLTVLTDPVFSTRIGMSLAGVTFGLSRVRPPAVDVDHLPKVDLVLISHAHFDHLDRPSLERLAEGPAKGATVITAVATRRLIPAGFGEVIELPWRRSVRHHGVTVSALRPEHWGARTAYDRHRRFNSYVLEACHERVLFAGDTAATDAFDRVGPVDLAVFGIGAYDPWEGAHATPEQVWTMYTGLSGGAPRGHLLPMHHSTFVLGREPLDEPLRRMRTVADGHQHVLVADMPGGYWHP